MLYRVVAYIKMWNERRDWHTKNKVIKDRIIEDGVVVIKNRVKVTNYPEQINRDRIGYMSDRVAVLGEMRDRKRLTYQR
jgi:hypothetical protein